MELVNRYLQQNKQSGIYYVRLNIPSDIQHHYGIKTLKRSLKTKNKWDAGLHCIQFVQHYKSEFKRLRLDSSYELNQSVTIHLKPSVVSPEASYSFKPESGIHMSEIIEKHCEEKISSHAWTEKTLDEYQSIYDLFLKVIGRDTQLNQLSHDLARTYKEKLMKLPAHIEKILEYQGLSIDQIIALNPKPITTNTVNKHLSRVNSLMIWAKRHGYIKENYFDGLQIKTKKKNVSRERLPFSQSDIDRLFGYSGKYKKQYQKWLLLLGYYTGARINEICQLHISDVCQEQSIWYLDINDDSPDKRLKNRSSSRKIPLHESVLDAGFIQYIAEIKLSGTTDRIFPELSLLRDGYAKNASRWFSQYRNRLGITDTRKSFHSFRHTFVENLKQTQVDPWIIAAMMGHADNSITTGRYGSGAWDIKLLAKAIQQLPNLHCSNSDYEPLILK